MTGRALTLAVLAMLGTSLSGCILEIPTPTLDVSKGLDKLPVDETGPWTYRDPTEKELLLARSDFSVEIVRFTDNRRPRSMETLSNDQIIYQYDPDTLLGGVSYEIPGVLGKYLSYRPKMPKHYKVEIEVKKLVTLIKAGTLWSGSWGRYYVDMELTVIARRPDSTVALQKTYRLEDEQRREDYEGRGPSKERDRARMFDLTESLLRKASENIGWDLRMRDARGWKVDAPQSIPTKLNLPPVDRAAGTPESDLAPLMPVAPAVLDIPTDRPMDAAPVPMTPVDAMPADAAPTDMDTAPMPMDDDSNVTPMDMGPVGPNETVTPVENDAIGPVI